jgi:DNA-binding transcriptional MerR regulator
MNAVDGATVGSKPGTVPVSGSVPSPAGTTVSGTATASGAALSDGALFRIGEAAERAGVSCRTLRYYEELELLVPAGHSAGGARRYTADDIARLLRIRELQELLGFDLGEIRTILRGEDQLADLRSEYNSGATLARRRAILSEASLINERLKVTVRLKQERLEEMMRELEARSKRHKVAAKKLDKEGAVAETRVSPGLAK